MSDKLNYVDVVEYANKPPVKTEMHRFYARDRVYIIYSMSGHL